MRPHFPRPLTALGRFETVFEQLVWVTAVQAAGAVFWAGGAAFGLSLVVAAAVVQAGLACRVAGLRACRRLRGGRTAELFARSIDDMPATAARPPKLPAPRPLTDPRVIREAALELRHVAGLLRAGPAVRGVALVEFRLISPATPLYGSDVEPLSQELRRALHLLTQNDRSPGA